MRETFSDGGELGSVRRWLTRPARKLGALGFALLTLTASLAGGAGCSPEIGDSCSTSVDCSANADRLCDNASPGGYCTVNNCDDGTCPAGSLCVEFAFEPSRLASRWCMKTCGNNGDCRTEDGYACMHADEMLDDDGNELARVVDRDEVGDEFCAVKDSDS